MRFFRRIIFSYLIKRKAEHISGKIFINGFSRVNSKTRLGGNVHFNGLKVIGNGVVEIGDNFHSGTGCLLITENHNFDHGEAIPYDNTFVTKEIVIEQNVWLGSNVIILPGTHIEEGAIVQAGAVVYGRVPRCAITGGNPSKVFKYRDIAHYDKLKLAKKFF